jgi:hypothetical protein
MRFVKFGLVVAIVGLFGIGVVSASDTAISDGHLVITDGRVNAWEVGAPAAIYCTFSDETHSKFTGIEVLDITPENNGVLALDATAAEIDAVGVNPSADSLIAQENGYSLYRAKSGAFYVVSPADAEGKTYTFVWERGDADC